MAFFTETDCVLAVSDVLNAVGLNPVLYFYARKIYMHWWKKQGYRKISSLNSTADGSR
jgi:hypothetical protein